MQATALIAEDEPLLAEALSIQLTQLWPELRLLPHAWDGDEVVERALAERPDVLFMDIRMPGRNGLDAAEAIAEAWPADAPLPLLVFVTAYDEHAVAGFERHAVDYVLKPVQPERLAATCRRLQALLAQRQSSPATDEASLQAIEALEAMRALQEPDVEETPLPATLRVLQVAVGTSLKFVRVDNVQYFEAADKYIRVVTTEPGPPGGGELLLRTPLRELIPSLDPERFWQIHRGIVVNIDHIDRVTRLHGKLRVHIRGEDDTLEVSRMFTQRFRAM